MTSKDIEWATWCVQHDTSQFYNSKRWRKVRKAVLQSDHHECQLCKTKYHRYRKADTVHHINHLKVRPDLALDATYRNPATHQEERNLISLCHDCHEEVHGYRMSPDQQPHILTEERWD